MQDTPAQDLQELPIGGLSLFEPGPLMGTSLQDVVTAPFQLSAQTRPTCDRCGTLR
jgi:hypothetical protein